MGWDLTDTCHHSNIFHKLFCWLGYGQNCQGVCRHPWVKPRADLKWQAGDFNSRVFNKHILDVQNIL